MSPQTNNIYEFEDFRLDFTEKTLRSGGSLIPLTPKVFETLLVFIENPGRLIEKDELMERIWHERFVEESNLSFNIKMLRKALGDDAAHPRFIETVPKRGYRFLAEVRSVDVKETDAERKIGRSANFGSSSFPVSSSPGPLSSGSQKGAVVALADWRPKEDTDEPSNALAADTVSQFPRPVAVPMPVIVKTVRLSNIYILAGLVSAIVLAGLSYWFFAIRPANTNGIESIAVLPFQNASGDANLDYFSDGLSEGIIDRLSGLPQLKVIARNSSFKFRGQEDWQQAATALGVRAIITGRVMVRSDNVVVRVELVDVRENRQLWSQQYNRGLADAPLIQDEITRSISERLSPKLSGVQEQQLAQRKTVNPQAFDLMLKGKFYTYKGGAENWKKAVECYEQAIAVDPEYAPAYTCLYWSYRSLIGRGVLSPQEFVPKAVNAAKRALELDPDLAEAHLALAYVKRDLWSWREAEASYKRALELNPNLAAAHGSYSAYLSLVGRHDEALAEAKRAGDLDPFSPVFSVNTGFAYFLARRYDEAIEALKNALELDRTSSNAHLILGLAYLEKKMYPESIAAHQEAVKLDKISPSLQISLATAYARAGQTEQAQAILKQLLESQSRIPPTDLSIFYAATGQTEQAFASLEQAYALHDIQLQYLAVGPAYDPLRPDPRFHDLLRRIGLSQ